MLATAISMKPAAACSGPRVSPVAAAIWALSSAKAARGACASRAASPRSPEAGGSGAGRVGSDPVPAAVEVQHGAAARGDGVNGQHRRPHPDPGDLGLVLALELAGEVRHVGGRAAHVEPDDLAEAGL